MSRMLSNFIAFQIGWFSCVLGAANEMPWLALMVLPIVLWNIQKSRSASAEMLLVLLAVILGVLLDSFLVRSGWLRYPSGMFIEGVAPYWILAMWALFATTLNASMSWLKKNLILAAVMGAVFGPLSYMAGERFGAIEFINFNASMLGLAVAWALAMPLLLAAAIRLDDAKVRTDNTQLPIQTGVNDA